MSRSKFSVAFCLFPLSLSLIIIIEAKRQHCTKIEETNVERAHTIMMHISRLKRSGEIQRSGTNTKSKQQTLQDLYKC